MDQRSNEELVCPVCGAEFEDVGRLKMHEAQEHEVEQETHKSQGIDEPVDESSVESFPSSDPPAETVPSE